MALDEGGVGKANPPSGHKKKHPQPLNPQQEHVSLVNTQNGVDDWVERRQRLLRALGYPVRVDGIWGPISQRYWNVYLGGGPTPSGAQQSAQVIAYHAAQNRIKNAQERVQALQNQALERQRQMSMHVRAALDRNKPSGDRRYDGIEGVRVRRSREVVQKAYADQAEFIGGYTSLRVARQMDLLRAHPAQASKLTIQQLSLYLGDAAGQFDPRKPEDVRIVQNFLRSNGHPELAANGVWGSATNDALLASLRRAAVQEQRQKVRTLVHDFYETGILKPGEHPFWWPVSGPAPPPGELLRLLNRGGFTASIIFNELVDRWQSPTAQFAYWRSQQIDRLYDAFTHDPSLTGALSRALEPPDWLKRMRIVSGSQWISPEDRAALDAQLSALSNSATLAEFRSKLRTYARVEEAKLIEEQRRRASESAGFWGNVFNQIVRPGEWVRTVAMAINTSIANDAEGEESWGSGIFKVKYGVLLVSEQEMEAARDRIENLSPFERIAYELIVDPINFIPFGKAFSLTGRGVGALGRETSALGLVIGRADGVAGDFGAVVARIGNAIEAVPQGKSLMKDYAGRLGHSLSHVHPNSGVGHQLAASIINTARLGTRLKSEALADAARAVRWSARHGFRPVKALGVEGLRDYKISAKVRRLVTVTGDDVKTRVPEVAPSLGSELRSAIGSMYANVSRGPRSDVGASVLARGVEEGRLVEIQRLAKRYYDDVKESALADGATEAEARGLAEQEYRRVRGAFATHRVGAGEPELLRELDARTWAIHAQWEEVILPRLQDLLEEWADAGGMKLFDEETGRWLFHSSDEVAALRETLREGFENTVTRANPMFNVPVTFNQFLELSESEIRRRQAAVSDYFERRAAVGEAVDQEALATRLGAERQAVLDAWEQRGADEWVDTREVIEVSPIYARNFADITDEQMMKELSDLGRTGSGKGLTGEIQRISTWLGGGPVPPPESMLTVDAAYREKMGGFVRSVERHQVALSRAIDEATPYALGSRLALMQAAASMQNKPVRVIYNGMEGALATWIFLTLPFRPGWVVRNVIDNTTKTLLAGARDPRAYFPNVSSGVGKAAQSFVDVNLYAVRQSAYFLDEIMGTNVGRWFDAATETFWQHNRDVLRRFFDAHLIPTPDAFFEAQRFRPYTAARPQSAQKALAKKRVLRGVTEDEAADFDKGILGAAVHGDDGFLAAVDTFKEKVWDLMASGPENFYRKALYRDTYLKAVSSGKSEVEAFKEAVEKVDATLFDYSKVSVTEDNFRLFFPFIQFWRKNTTFWLKTAVKNPALVYEAAHFEALRDELHDDLPSWMRRYFRFELAFEDWLAKVPGLDWLGEAIGNHDVAFDPLNFFSFAPLYRAFKQDNPLLPADKAGWKFIAPFFDAIEQYGLGMNPFVRRPLADLGVLDYRAWQQVFPETSVLAALTRDFAGDRWANRIIDLDSWLGDPLFRALGVGPVASQKLAESFNTYVQMEMANQAARGEVVSRERAVEKIQDFYLVQTVLGFVTGLYVRRMTPEDVFLSKMSEDLWKQKADWDSFTPAERRAYSLWRKRGFSPLEYDRYLEIEPLVQAYYRQGSYEAAQRFRREHPEITPYVEGAYRGRAFTSEGLRDAALVMDTQSATELFRLVDTLELSEKTTRLAESSLVTPELRAFWARNDTPHDIKTRMIRGEYFRYLNGLSRTFFTIPDDDFEAKEGFLAEHPMLKRFWMLGDSRGDSYKAIINGANADLRDAYFEIVERDGFDAASGFLHQFPFIFEFTRAAEKVDAQGNWISQFGERGMTQHAADYRAAKRYLDYYFSLPEAQRSAWLNSGNAGANVVLAYFKKYSHFHAHTRGFNSGVGSALQSVRSAELRQRLLFWQRYFAMDPDKRPDFVRKHAAEYGIFVFGIFGQREMEQKRAEWMRGAIAGGASARAAAYLWVKPLLDFFFTLSRKERQLFVRANPELEWYFDTFVNESVTGDPELDKLLDRYFNLPPGSDERALMLRKHPEIQDFFDSRSTPAERALHNLLEVYFSIPSGPERKEFLLKHPEIQEYFDRRVRQKEEEQFQLLPFEEADPRMAPYREAGPFVLGAAERQRNKLAAGRHAVGDLAVRREREPA